ncbi:MAG: peptidoglycan DD-metalloendopeptidase family protein [Bacteriovoracaceae bacterium]
MFIKLLTLSAFIISASSTICFGSLRPEGDAIDSIKDRLHERAREANSLAASINSLEEKIGKINNQYLEKNRQNHFLEDKLAILKDSLQKEMERLNKKENEAKVLARKRLLEMHDERDEHAFLKQTVLRDLMASKLKELKELQRRALELKSACEAYEEKLSEARKSEESLYALIVDLENKKKDLSQNYVSAIEQKNEWEGKFENALAKRKAYASASSLNGDSLALQLISPLEKFVDFKGGEKGVTFKYDDRSPIKASGSGKVVYSGELASYGKVIMLDHGEEVRSVILGDMELKVRKGDKVSQGQIIGYALTENGLKKSLYYEIRKKNVAQNTLQWLKNNQKLANI